MIKLMQLYKKYIFFILALLLFLPFCEVYAEKRVEPFLARGGMVVSAHALASRAGVEILQKHGNAVDAAVATAFVLGVVEPYSSGIGGGGFMLIYPGAGFDDEIVAIDFRERAPLSATRDMYKREGKVVPGLSTEGHLAAGVPGCVAGLALALERYGTMPLAEVMAPAIRFAEQGFPVSHKLYQAELISLAKLRKNPEANSIFLCHGLPHRPGQVLYQMDLARSLKAIAEGGPGVFYQGWIAETIEAEMKNGGGLIRMEDLAAYSPSVRRPVVGTYRGYSIVSMPPPSSGGTHVIEMLNMLEAYDINSMGFDSAEYVHILAEAMRRAFADRARFMGDPEFNDMPLERVLSKKYAESLRKTIRLDRATPSLEVENTFGLAKEGPSTTHISVVDGNGAAVSLTQTINTPFGSGVVVRGTGVLLNNEMDDFAADPGVPNVYGLIQSEANAIAPGKIPLSSMSPSLIFKDSRLFMVIGSPGGPRIITTVLQIILNVIEFGMNIQEANNAPRIHHQWLPDQVLLESSRLPLLERMKLRKKGHQVKGYFIPCNAQGIMVLPDGTLAGASDPRGEGEPAGVIVKSEQ